MKLKASLLPLIWILSGFQSAECQSRQFEIRQVKGSYDLDEQVYVLPGAADHLPALAWEGSWLPLASYLARFRTSVKGAGVEGPGHYWCRIALSNRLPRGLSIQDWRLVSLGDEIAEVHCAAPGDGSMAKSGAPAFIGACTSARLHRGINGIRLDIPAGSSVLLHIKVKTGGSGVPTAGFELRSVGSFAENPSSYLLRYDFLMVGFLFAYCFLCYVLFLGSDDRVFLYHFLFQAGLLAWMVNNLGFFPHPSWAGQHPAMLEVLMYAVVFGSDAAYLQFVRHFMGHGGKDPKADRTLKALTWLSLLFFVLVAVVRTAAGDKELADRMVIIFSILTFGMPLVLLMKPRKGSMRGLFIVTGTAFALLAALINGISIMLGLGERALITYSGLLGEVFFFSLGLGYHVKTLVLSWQRVQFQRERDEMKAGLYFEITNEFRTPLTVIQGMSAQLRAALTRPEELEKMDRIISSGNYLLRLAARINALANVHSGQQQLDLRGGDIMQFLRYWVFSFQPMAMEKDVRIRFLTEMEEFEMDFDAEKLQDVVTNLVTSSIRFSRVGSELIILAKAVSGRKGKEEFILQIKNAGSGISQEKLERAFGKSEVRGNMYGNFLAMVIMQELLQLMGGSFKVSSEHKGMDAVLTIRLPVNRKATAGHPLELPLPQPEASAVPTDMAFLTEGNAQDEKPLVLVVDSNDDVVHFIRYVLEKDYRLITASSGEEGIRKAIEHIPDIVISEIMIPGKSGLELCSTLKADELTSHIPVILMSAKASSVQSRIAGLSSGASTCLVKPFHQTELFFYLNNLLDAKRRFQSRFYKMGREDESKMSYAMEGDFVAEEDFIAKVREIVEANIDDEHFGVVQLCHKLGMSRSQLHRKIKALTGNSTSALVNNFRLDAARRLLLGSDLNVAEVAYRVGLEPNYFSRMFKESTGFTPTDFRNDSQHRDDTRK